MSSRDDLLIQLLMLEAGIVPFPMPSNRPSRSGEVNVIDRRISSLGPDQRRTIKRRFRKLWRKAARHFDSILIGAGKEPMYLQRCGLHDCSPTPDQRSMRRLLVIAYLRKTSPP